LEKIVAEIDLLAVQRGTVTAPAGCGKTHLIADGLARHSLPKPILVLTHTNAGVAALRTRLERAKVSSSKYRLATIDGWAMRLASLFPKRSGLNPDVLNLSNPAKDYPTIRMAAVGLLKGQHLSDILRASYDRLFVDEYQDCGLHQHAIVGYASNVLPTCVLGDPLQAIFGFSGPLVDWNKHVFAAFPSAGELGTPWRWKNAGTEPFGLWLLQVRAKLLAGQSIDLSDAPRNVVWVQLDGTEDHVRRLKACRIAPKGAGGNILIIGDSKSPKGQRGFASQTPGATAVESVDLRDLVTFAQNFDLKAVRALDDLIGFAEDVMTNVGGSDFLKRVENHTKGTSRTPPTDAEAAALRFNLARSNANAIDVLVELGKQSGVRSHRPIVLQACIRTLRACSDHDREALQEAAVRSREQYRMLGRSLPKRAVGSTLTLKGLESEVAVILNPAILDPANLYVAMTRGSETLVICSPSKIIKPA
jgi:hypothetical protein